MKRIRNILFVLLMSTLLVMSTIAITFGGEATTDTSGDTAVTIPEVSAFGDSGAHVASFQEKLIKLGFLHDVADGSFGNLTRTATEEFQSVYGLDADGVADVETLDVINSITECLSDEALGDVSDTIVWNTVEVQHSTDGKYYVQPNTVSDKNMWEAYYIMTSVIEAYMSSNSIPEHDVVLSVASEDDENSVLLNQDIISEDIQFTDINGNNITIDTEHNISSDTGNITLQLVDYDTNEVIDEPFEVLVDELTVEMQGELSDDNIQFRNIVIQKANDEYQVETNTVSETTLDAARKVYTAIRYAYLNSTEIPSENNTDDGIDSEGVKEVDINNLPNGVSADDVIYNQDTDTYYVPATNNTTNNNSGTNNNTVVNNDTRQNSYEQPSQNTSTHTHNWTPVYKSVHYNAGTHLEPVYVTVHHDAVTHQEPIYETVYHPAVYEQEFYGYKQVLYTVVVCYCGAEFSTADEWVVHADAMGRGHGAYRTESRYYEDTSQPLYADILIQDEYYEDVLQGYETIIDSQAYDEQVLDHYNEVTDQAAHDEQVIDYYICYECGATKK